MADAERCVVCGAIIPEGSHACSKCIRYSLSRNMDLCVPCVNAVSKEYAIKFVSGGVGNKITCSLCGRRRFGATYTVDR